MIWLEAHYTDHADPASPSFQYSLTVDILSSGGINPSVFVYRLVDDVFSHVAMAFDMNTTLPSKAEAIAANHEYYRSPHYQVSFATSNDLAHARRVIKARLKLLVRQWRDLQTASLEDSVIEVYTSE